MSFLSCLVSSRLIFLSKVELEDFLRAVVLGRTNWDMVTTGRASQLVGSVEFPGGEVRSASLESSFAALAFFLFLTADLRICVSSRLVLPCVVVSCLVLPFRVVSCRAVPCHGVSCHVVSCRVLPCLVPSCLVLTCHSVTFCGSHLSFPTRSQ